MESIKTIVAKNLLFYRKKSKLSQKELASIIGIKHNTISSWENETNSIDIDTLFKICEILNVDINTMFGVENNNSQSCNTNCTPKEQKIVEAYRSKPEMQSAVNKLLGMEEEYAEDFIIA